MRKETIVISLGGSLIVPEKIDVNFLKKFKEVIMQQIKRGKKFAIVTGGGKTARNYQNAGKAVAKLSKDEADWLGIYATHLNACLIRTMFGPSAHPDIITIPHTKVKLKKQILIAAGWKPGRSTDNSAVLIAKQLRAKKIINLSNINYIYDKDPRKYKNAKPIKEASWEEFKKLLPKKWIPGANVPFDPIATKEAAKLKLEVVTINGKDTANLKNYLNGKRFNGTVIR